MAPDATSTSVHEPRLGRPPATSRAELEQIALDLFAERGFDAVTVDDIAGAAGIGRRTLFRYFPSKNDLVWGDFELGLVQMRGHLSAAPAGVPLLRAVRDAVVAFNAVDPGELSRHRARMRLILEVPALQAHSTIRYADWRQVVARFAGQRLGEAPEALRPQLVAHAALGAAVTAYEQWLAGRGELTPLLEESLDLLASLESALRT